MSMREIDLLEAIAARGGAAWDECEHADVLILLCLRLAVRRALGEGALRRIACDVAAPHLAAWERRHPRADRVRRALETAIQYSCDEVTAEGLSRARSDVLVARRTVDYPASRSPHDAPGESPAESAAASRYAVSHALWAVYEDAGAGLLNVALTYRGEHPEVAEIVRRHAPWAAVERALAPIVAAEGAECGHGAGGGKAA